MNICVQESVICGLTYIRFAPFESQSCRRCAVAEVWRSYRLGKSIALVDVTPSRTILFLSIDMAAGVRLLRQQVSALSRCVKPTRVAVRHLSLFTRPKSTYEEHVPLTPVGRLGLAISSGLGAFLDPRKGGTYGFLIHAITY
jgi:hypothetical protein